jgi:signal transduction histidine kinase/CheY-like chemotaxis protein
MAAIPDPLEERILLLAPTGRDATLTCRILEEVGLVGVPCADEQALYRQLGRGAGAALVADEALTPHTVNRLLDVLGGQPPWSDLPLVVFTRRETSDEVLATLEPLGNATLLERPVRVATLLTALRAALRARRRQYQVRDLFHRLAEADRRKDEFLAMLGHELRNPLAAISNSLSVLEQPGVEGERARRQRQVIDRQTRHLARMVDDLLDISRVTLGKIALQRQNTDLFEVIERCLEEAAAPARARNQDLRLSGAGPVVVDGDPVRLEQVISNLLHNALKYTPVGGRIEVELASEGDVPASGYAIVRVRDTGIGISADMLAHIFEPFTQLESSLARSQGGLGLGLPLVRSLVELHGGRIDARSDGPESGSEFTVRLPLGDQAAWAAARTRPVGRGETSQEGLNILVVEDNLDGRESLRDLLEIWGHHVEVAASGSEGLARALATRPQVALLDIGLPELDGNELARRIRAALGREGMRLIAMTGYGQPEDRLRSLNAGFDDYLVKPVDPGQLARLLDGLREGVGAGGGGGGHEASRALVP